MTKTRFKKGDKIEVFRQKEVPSGCWCCAEIISGNGHNYTVKYDTSIGIHEGEVLDRVPRKAIRPCQPVAEVTCAWVSGDVVEVFNYFDWRVATVLQVLSNDRYLVRLVGSLQETEVGERGVRPRFCWQDDEWVAIPKGSDSNEDMKRKDYSSLKYDPNSAVTNARASRPFKDEFFAPGNIGDIQDSLAVPSRSLKKSFPFQQSVTESCARPCQKVRVNEKGNMRIGFAFLEQPPSLDKVDADASLKKKKVGETYISTSSYDRLNRCSKMMLEREETNGAIGCSGAMNLETSDDNVASSTDSCEFDGLRRPLTEFSDALSGIPYDDNDRHSSDAESSNQSGSEEKNLFLSREKMLAEEVHRLELNAYRGIIKALHAMGPLSWERETLLTDLRLSLNISNDEHLMELRHLVSSSTSIPAC